MDNQISCDDIIDFDVCLACLKAADSFGTGHSFLPIFYLFFFFTFSVVTNNAIISLCSLSS